MIYRQQIDDFTPKNEQEKMDKSIIIDYIDQFQSTVLTRANRIAHMTSSGLILNEDLSRVLVIHHKLYNNWGWTGGHSDGDEDLLKTAIREAKEETGITEITPLTSNILTLDILPVWGHIKKGHYVSAHLHLNVAFVLIACPKQKLILNQEETSGVKWINASEIGSYSNEPVLIDIYKKLIKRAHELR
ncbi:MAG: NUDIX hydrolase [Spirochaetaceae bacterium]